MIGPIINATNPWTANPGVSTDANQKQKPLTTRENNPKLRRFKGRDNTESIGLIKLLTKPIVTPAIKATGKELMLTPLSAMSTTSKLRAVANTVKKYPNIIYISPNYVYFDKSTFLLLCSLYIKYGSPIRMIYV